jgi:transglutaminase-like putative cysteine protease
MGRIILYNKSMETRNNRWIFRSLLFLMPILALSCTLFAPAPSNPTTTPSTAHTIIPTATLNAPTLSPSLTPSAGPARVQPQAPAARYDVVETIHITNQGPQKVTRLILYVVLVNTIPPFQKVLSTNLSPKEQSIQTDPDGNRLAVFEFKDLPAGSQTVVTLQYQVEVTPLRTLFGNCQGIIPPDLKMRSEKYLEVDASLIRETSAGLVKGKTTVCEKARAIYDFVADTMTYSGYNPLDVGALKALTEKKGDCTEYTDLFIALSRAAGLPARYIDGITCCTNGNYQAADTKHNWAEIYLPEVGWVTVDPTWGRFQTERDRYFARHPVSHIVVGYGRNSSMLAGFHFYYFRYWREDEATKVKSEEEWSITKTKE